MRVGKGAGSYSRILDSFSKAIFDKIINVVGVDPGNRRQIHLPVVSDIPGGKNTRDIGLQVLIDRHALDRIKPDP